MYVFSWLLIIIFSTWELADELFELDEQFNLSSNSELKFSISHFTVEIDGLSRVLAAWMLTEASLRYSWGEGEEAVPFWLTGDAATSEDFFETLDKRLNRLAASILSFIETLSYIEMDLKIETDYVYGQFAKKSNVNRFWPSTSSQFDFLPHSFEMWLQMKHHWLWALHFLLYFDRRQSLAFPKPSNQMAEKEIRCPLVFRLVTFYISLKK